MFEKFTEKAINVVSTSQTIAKEIGARKVSAEILLLALFDEAKGFSLKIFKSTMFIVKLILTLMPLLCKVVMECLSY